MIVERPQWDGRTVVCIASGPSLTSQDCEIVRASGAPTVVTNTTFRLCPWADALFGFDAKWWKVYHEEVEATFRGRRFGGTLVCEKYGVNVATGQPWFKGFRNSGACAVSLAIGGAAAKIVLLGYDMGFSGGRTHWHGDHPHGLENATSLPLWAEQFAVLAKHARRSGVEVVNASRETRMTCFPRAVLESAL